MKQDFYDPVLQLSEKSQISNIYEQSLYLLLGLALCPLIFSTLSVDYNEGIICN